MSPKISIRLLAAQSDQRLLALARDGHERAFEALVQRYRRPLLRYGRHMQLSEARAEDVLQQALMQAWIALSRGTAVHDVRGWLYRIVHNAALNAMRGSGEANAELTPALQDRAALATPSDVERTIAVRDALGEVAALPRMQRQAIFLTAVDGQTHAEVAYTLGVSEGALRGLLYRARSTLRSAAAALTPPPLLEWAAGAGGTAAPTVERLGELTAGGGAVGVAGLLLKGSVLAVTAGGLVTGAGVVASHDRARHAGRQTRAERTAPVSTNASRATRGDRSSVEISASTPHAVDVRQVLRARHHRDHLPGHERWGHGGSDDAAPGRHDVSRQRFTVSAGEFDDSRADRHRPRGHDSTDTREAGRQGADEVEVSDLRHSRSGHRGGSHEHGGSLDSSADGSTQSEQSTAFIGSDHDGDRGGGGEDGATRAPSSGSGGPPQPLAEESSADGGQSGQSATGSEQSSSDPEPHGSTGGSGPR